MPHRTILHIGAERLLRLRGTVVNPALRSKQLPLFGAERNKALATAALDHINDRYGELTVTYGSILDEAQGSKVISPAWRPDGMHRIDVS